MTTPVHSSEEKPRSPFGGFFCAVLATILFPVLFALGWMTASPIYAKKEAIELFVSLRDGSYRFFSGRTLKAMILNYSVSGSVSKK